MTRTGPDYQGGYTWTVTWLTALGNQPPLTFANLLTGSGATINGTTVQNGNSLGGNYQLSYHGQLSAPIPFNVSASNMTQILEDIVGLVSVYRSPTTTEGGSYYLVTFLGLQGDLDLLVPQYSGTLTGQDAVVVVMEIAKGSIASGSLAKVSFNAALYCSQSQVPAGTCGAPVDMYSLEVGNTKVAVNQIIPIVVDQTIQMVRISALSLFDPIYFTGKQASGYFRLAYNGATTAPISSFASAGALRDALEKLPDVNTVAVTQSYSAEQMTGTLVAEPGMQYLICADSCNINR